MTRLFFFVFLVLNFIGGAVWAHDLRPGYLGITEKAPDSYSVLWKVPALGGQRLTIIPRLPNDAEGAAPRESVLLDDAFVERWTVHGENGFAGQTIAIEGLSVNRTDVLVRIERLNGETSTVRLTPARPSFEVPAASGPMQVATAYLWLGAEHILYGIDHLLFVLGLILLVRGWKQIAITITAFTLAHSITLAAATLGFLNMPGPPVDAVIALSISLLAVEIVNLERGRKNLTASFPWLVAFVFGLLHGLGFAGALSATGLPGHAIPLALLFFNVGVELGQLVFVAAVMLAMTVLTSFTNDREKVNWLGIGPRTAAAYCIGGLASFWLLERVASFWA